MKWLAVEIARGWMCERLKLHAVECVNGWNCSGWNGIGRNVLTPNVACRVKKCYNSNDEDACVPQHYIYPPLRSKYKISPSSRRWISYISTKTRHFSSNWFEVWWANKKWAVKPKSMVRWIFPVLDGFSSPENFAFSGIAENI